MANENLEKKFRFLPFLPYGFCSTLATTITGRKNPYASEILIGDGDDNSEACSKRHRENTVARAKYLTHRKFTRDAKRSCGTPSREYSFRFLTKAGLLALVECPEEVTLDTMRHTENDWEGDGEIKEEYKSNRLLASADLRDYLYDAIDAEEEDGSSDFADLLLEAVMAGAVTPMTYAMAMTPKAKITTSKYSQHQLYSIWRLSHVAAMFHANNYLTWIDRRPYDTGFAIDGIKGKDSYDAYVQKHGYTPAALSYYALSNWYKNNPGYYRLTQQYPDGSPAAKDAWLRTPVFYGINELPYVETPADDDTDDTIRSNDKTSYPVAIGLAMGRKHNFLCYHGKPGSFKWLKKREARTKENMERVIHAMKTHNPEIEGNVSVEFGLYFCASHYQFAALFERTIERHKSGLKANFTTDAPYTSLHAIPVNDSGTCLLWCLMESSPIETEMRICNTLVSWDIGFSHQTNHYYPLTYDGKWVFAGYTMDISKINHALIDYLDGKQFYICCFPDQAVWYRQLFPGIQIL